MFLHKAEILPEARKPVGRNDGKAEFFVFQFKVSRALVLVEAIHPTSVTYHNADRPSHCKLKSHGPVQSQPYQHI